MKIPGFLLEFITPIVKVKKEGYPKLYLHSLFKNPLLRFYKVSKGKDSRKQEISFFTIPEYESWKGDNEDGKGWTIKYYKVGDLQFAYTLSDLRSFTTSF